MKTYDNLCHFTHFSTLSVNIIDLKLILQKEQVSRVDIYVNIAILIFKEFIEIFDKLENENYSDEFQLIFKKWGENLNQKKINHTLNFLKDFKILWS